MSTAFVRPSRLPALVLLGALAAATGCTPAVAPVYHDFAPRAAVAEAVSEAPPSAVAQVDAPLAGSDGAVYDAALARVRRALHASGWRETASPDPRVLATAPRVVAAGLLSQTEASLLVTPLSGGHVRVQAVALRRGAFGGRTRLPYLAGGLRRSVFGGLESALAAEGFVAVGSPEERDARRSGAPAARENRAETR